MRQKITQIQSSAVSQPSRKESRPNIRLLYLSIEPYPLAADTNHGIKEGRHLRYTGIPADCDNASRQNRCHVSARTLAI